MLIVRGGRTGVDRTALDIALKFGFPAAAKESAGR